MIYYFGYGANRDSEMMKSIIGRRVTGVKAQVRGFDLCIQELNDIPKRARQILSNAWNNDFKSYALRQGSGVVNGVLWELRDNEKKFLDNWELVNNGWFNNTSIKAFINERVIQSITQVITNQSITQVVDGLDYHSFLMPKQEMLRVANQCRTRLGTH